MPTWFADGSVSGFAIDNNTPEEGLPAITQDVIHLATAGSVDANGITRLQYDVPGPYFRRAISAVARLQWTSAETQDVLNNSRVPIAAMWVADAADFPAGKVPKPSEILALGPSKVALVQATPPSDLFTNASLRWTYIIDSVALSANRKYWVLVGPAMGINGEGYDWNSVTFYGNPDTVGRAVSVWGNRTPLAPTISAPAGDVLINAGETFDLTWVPHDPDGFFGAGSSVYTDTAGVHVQYAPRPSQENPSPTWIDLPIATRTGAVLGAGAGWYIDRSAYNNPVSLTNSGAYYFWALGTMKVKGGSNTLDAGAGILPSGDWQIRVRTFDYGHPYPRWAKPLARADGNLSPYAYPEANTSPWSTPIKVSVASQVPFPIPLSPINNTAIPVDQPVTLVWKYRNTALPPLLQKRRTVDIRKVGDEDWTSVSSEESLLTSFTLSDTGSTTPAFDYFGADGGFENGTAPGWVDSSSGTTGLSVPNNAALAHNGSRYLTTVGAGNIIPSVTFALRDQDQLFTFKGWSALGPNSTKHTYVIAWLRANGTLLAQIPYDRPAGAGYVQTVIADIARPAGAASIQVGVLPILASGQTSSAGDRFDDFALSASESSITRPFTVEAGNQYEWRVRVVDTSGFISNYSNTARFWVVPTPASGIERPVPSGSTQAATLGRGKHRAFIYRRGGKVRVGELTGLSHVDWERKRDDISTAKVVVSDWDIDCGNLLASLEPWEFELVLFRNNGYGAPKRVWEGPLMLPTYESDKVTINAKDVMAYPYRRIIKQALNDSKSGASVTSRAARILQNVLAPDDPNLLSYLTVITEATDPKQYRNVPEWSRTAFEEIDDMAANSGLDYTAVGRRIILWGTKNRIGTLPEFRDADLGSSPIVSVYGMSMANVYGVSDGAGVHGEADRLDAGGKDEKYGLVEMLSSSWASDSPEDSGTYTQAGLETVRESFKQSADRSLGHRYPPPVVVRIPDNTTLNPDTVIDIQQLVPGSVVPLRSTSTLRKVVADQKLDSIKVVEESGVEKITIVLSPFSRDDAGTDEETTE